jgi:multidrug efflux pump subunit AcrB
MDPIHASVTGTTFNISSFMGTIMVVGLVIKNGILMLDSEQHFSGLGMPLKDAIFEACAPWPSR